VTEVLDLDVQGLVGVEVFLLVTVQLRKSTLGAVTCAVVVIVGGVEPAETEIEGL